MPATLAPPHFERLVFGDKHQIEAVRLYERRATWFDLPDCEACSGAGDCPTCDRECEECDGFGKPPNIVEEFRKQFPGHSCP